MPFKEKEEKCKYAEGDYKCSRTARLGDKYCIFHSKDIEGKKGIFNKEFWEKEFKTQKKDEKKYDFTGFVFPVDISFEKREFEKDVCFLGAKFFGEADFRKRQDRDRYFIYRTPKKRQDRDRYFIFFYRTPNIPVKGGEKRGATKK